MRIADLKVVNTVEPIGTGGRPYFSWKLESEERNTLQESLRIIVTDENGTVCMDSGVVKSRKNAWLPYTGVPLESRTAYNVSVCVTDNHGSCAQRSTVFETGLLHHDDWSAEWVTSGFKRKKAKPGFGNQDCSTLFRQVFCAGGKLIKARLYVTAHGIYELYLNGRRPDRRSFAPEHTVYEKYLCYQTYDVTELITEGKNCVALHVGDGWYFSPNAKPNMKTDNSHAVLFQLELIYEDGETTLILSGKDTLTAKGPVVSADLFAGERYDAEREILSWNQSECRYDGWRAGRIRKYGYDNLVPQAADRVMPISEISVAAVLKSPAGETILDFGQNFSGRVRARVKLPRGHCIRLEHCEVLDKDGNYYNNVMSAGGVGKGCDQTDEFISAGKEYTYEPHFTYHGFRYVKVTVDGKAPEHINPDDFTGIALSSEKNNTGSFNCSDRELNQLYSNIRWSQYSNMLSVPTDCPQREKAGWTGDMLVYAETAMQNEDCTILFSRWLENMAAEQDRYGIIPMVVPEDGPYPLTGKIISLTSGMKGKATSSGWGDAAVIVPYAMYRVTGNTEILKQQYYTMRRWCDYIIRQAETKKPKGSSLPEEIERYLWDTGYHYGEWLVPSQSKNGMDMKNLKTIMASSSCYTAPIFGWYSVSTFAEICEILSLENPSGALYATDAQKYKDTAEKMKTAIQKGIIRQDGSMPSTLMGAYVLPISMELVPEQHKEVFAHNLIRSLEDHDMCMDTGFLATPFLLDALCKINRQDLAYSLLWQTKVPSWLSEVKNGATTIWENCFGYDENGNPGTMSFNHYAFGSVADWIFRNVNGIVPVEAGYTRVKICPIPDGRLTGASREFETINGTLAVNWQIREKADRKRMYSLKVRIPCNVTAEVILPDGRKEEIGSGEYSYETEI